MAFAIGARSQMARTYLEKNVEEFAGCGREELIRHGLKALKESLVQDRELTVENLSVGVVGVEVKDGKRKVEPFKVFDGQDVAGWIESVADDKEGDEEGGDAPAAEAMEVDA